MQKLFSRACHRAMRDGGNKDAAYALVEIAENAIQANERLLSWFALNVEESQFSVSRYNAVSSYNNNYI